MATRKASRLTYGGHMSATESATGQSSERTGSQMVDWELAISTARRLVRPGPDVSAEEAHEVVAELRELASRSEEHVRAYTGLHADTPRPTPVIVVDRNGWVQANADAFRQVLSPLTEKLEHRVAERRAHAETPGMASSVSARMTGLEAGALLAFLSGKVLGQFDPFWVDGSESPNGAGGPAGRLLLVAPNVVHVERELGVDPRDFRMWVCLHEETHRVQFTAVPWLRDHLRGQIRLFLEQTELDPGALANQLRSGVDQMLRAVRGEQEVSLIDVVQTPDQRAILDRLTAVMSLLEGHADVVMDGVGPQVIPSVAQIRERFQQRRSGGGWFDQLLKRVLGLDAKLRQYREGAAFVRHIVDRVGQDGFNAVWESPDNLPTRTEITDPEAWVRRVHPS